MPMLPATAAEEADTIVAMAAAADMEVAEGMTEAMVAVAMGVAEVRAQRGLQLHLQHYARCDLRNIWGA